MSETLTLEALAGLPEIRAGDDLAHLLAGQTPPGAGILAVAQKIVSKAEARAVPLCDVRPGTRAQRIARTVDKDPRHVELVLSESVRVVRAVPGILICETRHGFICANAGVDFSNVSGEETALLLPLDPDASARAIRTRLGSARGVIITDTFGRPWREGLVDVAIGVAGLAPLQDQRGETDRNGRALQVTVMARADQLAAAAGLLMRKASGTPAVWIRGVAPSGDGRARELLRPAARDLFRD